MNNCRLISYTYKYSYQGVLYQKSFNLSLILISLITTAVIIVISGNLVLSLGMVGALSIVRFRAAVKDPLDIVFMFWAVSIGIANGVAAFKVSFSTSIIISIIIIIVKKLPLKSKSFMLIVKCKLNSENKLFKVLSQQTKKFYLKSKNINGDQLELIFETRINDQSKLTKKISELPGISDVNILNSLPKREIICGYGEILKHAIISDRKIFNYLKKNCFKILKLKSPFIEKAISDSCKIKRNIVQQDEKEKNLRKILNLGHTFAHAYEATLAYSKKLNHGEAVILGIVSAAKFSIENNILRKKDYEQIINHVNNLKIPVDLNFYFKKKDINSIIKYMKSDKKNNSSKINLILIKNIGKTILDLRYDQSEIKKFLTNELIY